MSVVGYHDSRLVQDRKRDVVWKALWRYFFARRIGQDDCVLDLGCGYGEFINNVTARRRIAVDVWESMPAHVDQGVETIVGPASDLSAIDDHSVDYAFSSNLFEHLTKPELAETLRALKRQIIAPWNAHHAPAQLPLLRRRIFRRLHPCQRLVACQPGRFPRRQRL